jgi:TonB family protein
MEATTTVTPLSDSDRDLFRPLSGVAPTLNRFGASREDGYQVLTRGEVNSSSFGEALVKVYVDASGRVRHAELLDADDKSLGKAALTAAKNTVYMPQEVNGHPAPFETSVWTSHWSTIDPLRVVETSRKSQGTD